MTHFALLLASHAVDFMGLVLANYDCEGGYTCADVENNKSFTETSPDRFLRSTKTKIALPKFTSANIGEWFGQLFIVYIFLPTCVTSP